METKPYSLQAPEAIAKEYGGNKQKIAQAVQMGIVNPTAALLAGMFIDRMRNAAPAEQAPTQTVAEEVFNPQPAPSMPAQGLPAMRQPQMPQGMPPQGLAAMGQPQMTSMASGGAVGYARGGSPFYSAPEMYENRNAFDFEIEDLKNQLRGRETDSFRPNELSTEDRRGLAERLKQLTMGNPSVLPEYGSDASLIELGERNKDLRALDEIAQERYAEKVSSFDENENNSVALNSAISDTEMDARNRIKELEADNFAPSISDSEFNDLITGGAAEEQPSTYLDAGEQPSRQVTEIDEDGNPIDGNAYIGNKGIERDGGLQAIVNAPIDESPEPVGIEAATSDYKKLQEMLGKSETDEDMTKEAVQARADKEKREDTLTSLAEFGFRMAASDSPYFLQAAGEAGAGTAPTFKDAISRSRTTVEDARKERKATALSARSERIELLKEAVNRLSGKEKAAAEKRLKEEEFALRRELKGIDEDIARIYKPAGEKTVAEKERERIEALVRKENPTMSDTAVVREAARIGKGAASDEVDKYELGKRYEESLADEQAMRYEIQREIDAGGKAGFTAKQLEKITRIMASGNEKDQQDLIEELLIARRGQRAYDVTRNLERQYNEQVLGIESVDDSPGFKKGQRATDNNGRAIEYNGKNWVYIEE
tara:strand:+ start:426 stop:2390 length:1965 start_codon:yes stop_codon:yes gene_type:complete